MIVYGLAMALGAFALSWLEYQYAVRLFSTEAYILGLAVGFTAMGIWVGHRLTGPRRNGEFKKNTRALESLGISEREYQVLELLAEGCTNKEIGVGLGRRFCGTRSLIPAIIAPQAIAGCAKVSPIGRMDWLCSMCR